MENILITGATGNIGSEVIRLYAARETDHTIIAGVRDIQRARDQLGYFAALQYRAFDFEDSTTYAGAFAGIGILFLLRPPHISDVEKVFKPLLTAARQANIQKVVFLSVQGVEKSSIIPHHKIEKLLHNMGFACIFVRPSYFMQNLTTTLLPDIQQKKRIVLPAGKAPFNWIDIENIAEAVVQLLEDFDRYQYQAFEITGSENKDFGAVADLLRRETGINIGYKNMNPLSFYLLKRKEKLPAALILVMIMLHFLPRFQQAPAITDHYKKLTGKDPGTLQMFVRRESQKFK